jgi:uncharacterized protein YyaL (SSP411 family)
LGKTSSRENCLKDEVSPYLLQHAENPVAWQPWGEAAFAAAAEEDKPVLLSVGYSACHWCHVMAHESFEDPAIAALMNEHFISVKVDREERPDVDQIYQRALLLMGKQGGWPLTMFLRANGEPFWGGTYFPPQAGMGLPSFPNVIERLAEVFREDKELVAKNAETLHGALAESLAGTGQGGEPANLTLQALNTAARAIVAHFDPYNGGLSTAPKFPQAPVLGLMWRAHALSGEANLKGAVLLTLRRMSRGGIYDHLGGGYARYAVDNAWLVPHFEKMLYDNALILELLTLGHQATGKKLFAARARETVGWLLREMRQAGGSFASALDADSEGREGAFYVWDLAEIKDVLGDEADFFAGPYGISADGNWEGTNILNQLDQNSSPPADEEARLAACRAKLLKVRDKRPRPLLDDKILADWNGMTIAALARAAMAFDEPAWLEAAEEAFSFISTTMADPEGGLYHSWRDGKSGSHGFLDDYAQMVRAALFLHDATGTADYLDAAEGWARELGEHFVAEGGGFHLTSARGEALILRPRIAQDGPVPSGNAVAAEVLAKLYFLTGKKAYRAAAEDTLQAFGGEAMSNPAVLAGLWNALYGLAAAPQIVIRGARSGKAVKAMIAALRGSPLADYSLLVVGKGDELPDRHPAAGKSGPSGTAFVCRGTTCSLPLDSPAKLAAELAGNPENSD